MKWVAAKRRIGKVGERGDCCCTCILLIGTVSKSDEDDRGFSAHVSYYVWRLYVNAQIGTPRALI